MSFSIVEFDDDFREISRTEIRRMAFVYDWAIVDLDADCVLLKTTPEVAYGFLTTDESLGLKIFGRVKDDYRKDELTDNFADGHRIITSQIVEASRDGICTENTHYTLGEASPKYAEWCKNYGYDFAAALEEGRKYLVQ